MSDDNGKTSAVARKNGVMTFAHDEGARALRWSFPSLGGRRVEYVYSEKLPEMSDVDYEAMRYGFNVKISRAAALGQDATATEKADAMDRVVANLRNGIFNEKPGGAMIDEDLIVAVASRFGFDRAEAHRKLSAMSKRERDLVAADPQIFAAMEAARKARAKSVDSKLLATLLANLGKAGQSAPPPPADGGKK